MQNGSQVSLDAEANSSDCTFCQRGDIATYILKETTSFLVVADHAPLVEGHLLIIPKRHYVCYGAVPAELDAEFYTLKQEVKQFLIRFYAPVVFWEHGIFRQTVFHAHLHCFPFGITEYHLSGDLHGVVVHSQEDIRAWYTSKGPYFYMEDSRSALLFAPQMDGYLQIIRDVLWQGVVSRSGRSEWRSQQQRYEEGAPLIEPVTAKWRLFKGAEYANESSTR